MNRKKLIEKMYCGRCDVIERRDAVVGDSAFSRKSEEIVLRDVPCRLSFSSLNKAEQTERGAVIAQSVKLFFSPEYRISSGSKVIVTQSGVTRVFCCSGAAAVYGSHCEIMLAPFERWA